MSADPPDDWRRQRQERFMAGRALVWSDWSEYRPGWDHDHCVFCWATLSAFEGDLHSGYVTEDLYHWVCRSCCDDCCWL